MRWIKTDTTQYLPEKEYIDTVIIPLIPFDPADDSQMPKHAFQRELNQIFTQLVEKEYRGRVFLSPEYYYLHGQLEQEVERLNRWIEQFNKQPFQHIFLFTFDPKWKKHEKELTGQLLWVPGMMSGNIQSTETQSFVKEQAHQISEFIQAFW
ncbi:YpiF family protein [Halobacillus mangrovi]|uniref:DUF2487 domain-containing protein n=1 Tax=Halobacillus mangrovi TaxID=402384 RepID=A0A1W5ZVI8_9BACI|nr:YpiF family protein [Halobacillus mangrovi]ARI77261.1 hypothetical protein HM131_10595 [Halobacillus mangrovi]